MRHLTLLTIVVISGLFMQATRPAVAAEPQSSRVRRDLQTLYDFRSPTGSIVRDRSGVGKPLDLRITKPQGVRRSIGSLQLSRGTLVRCDAPAAKIINSVRRSGEITLETWIQPANIKQSGPARIVTLSSNSTNRNFTLGQDGNRFDARLRTTRTSNNGLPSLNSPAKTVNTRRMHVVYARDRSGRTTLYLNGKRSANRNIEGGFSNWDNSMRLALGDEQTGQRAWLGTYYLVAIYSRALTASEVQQNFSAGPGGTTPARIALKRPSPNEQFFETKIAKLFVQQCLECHDSATKKGELDLSRRLTALAGGESGTVISPGKSADSLLWEAIQSNDMPKDREPLSAGDKQSIRQWLDRGATWSLDRIDPAVYVHEGRTSEQFVQRLTVPEYIETVRVTVGVDIEKEAKRILPADLRADGFSNTAYNLNVDLGHVEAYAELAETVVARMDVPKFVRQYSQRQQLTDDNMREVIAKMGRWLLRGPLDPLEVDTFLNISQAVAEQKGDFQLAVSLILEGMLQSPRFIYRIEEQHDQGEPRPLGGHELAVRMSYIIWGGPPDQELMRAADKGELFDRKNIEAQVQRMLADKRAVGRSLQFVEQWLHLARLDTLQPDRARYPSWNKQLAADMRAETLAFFQEIVWKQKRPLADLMNAQITMATPRLAKHYGLTPQGGQLDRYDVSKVSGRGGLLTQGSVLTIGGDESSMVTRGLFVLHDLLRGVVKSPPPAVDTTPKPTRAGLTQRGIALARMADKSCGGCHSRFEPLAFGLEKYDGIGTLREFDKHGNKLQDNGKILFPGEGKAVKYNSSTELMNLLAASDRVQQSITWKMTQFALGRPLLPVDARTVDKIHQAAQKGGGTYTSLMTAIVMSDLVQWTRAQSTSNAVNGVNQ